MAHPMVCLPLASPLHAGKICSLPTSRVYNTTPRPQISTGSAAYPAPPGDPSYRQFRSTSTLTSGATYGRLPHRPLSSLVLPLCRKTAHSPKSDILRLPFAASSRFSGLRSRCAIPLEWTNSCTRQLDTHRSILHSPHRRASEQSRIWPSPPGHPHPGLSSASPKATRTKSD